MARVKAPLMSIGAQKQLGKALIYKQKGSRSFVTGYNKPGGQNPSPASPSQLDQRMLYNLIIARWQTFSDVEKAVWNDDPRRNILGISGWNLFLREALRDLPTYLGLQGYWSFNKIVDGKILDLSGNNNHGTLEPNYPSNAPVLVNSIGAKFGKAGSFDGANDYVDITNYIVDKDNGTIEVWIKTSADFSDNYSGLGAIIGKADRYRSYLAIGGDGSSNYNLKGETNTNGQFFLSKDNVVTVGQWNHIVSSFSGGTVKTYLNSSLIDTKIVTDNLILTRIGGGTTVIDRSLFKGIIDEVKIYDRALSAEEILKHYKLITIK